VATIVDSRPGELVLARVTGRHGQERIDRGEGEAVHRDFGPNNVLFGETDDAIVLLADWEWSTVLPTLFDGYGRRPAWPERQAAMADRAAALEAWVRSHRGAAAATTTWNRRSRAVAGWREIG